MIYKGPNFTIAEDEYEKALGKARVLLADVFDLDDDDVNAMPALDVLARISEHFVWGGLMWHVLCYEETKDRQLLREWNEGKPIGRSMSWHLPPKN